MRAGQRSGRAEIQRRSADALTAANAWWEEEATVAGTRLELRPLGIVQTSCGGGFVEITCALEQVRVHGRSHSKEEHTSLNISVTRERPLYAPTLNQASAGR